MVVGFDHNSSPSLPVAGTNHPSVVCVPVLPSALEKGEKFKKDNGMKRHHLRPWPVTPIDLVHEVKGLLRHLNQKCFVLSRFSEG